MLKIAYQGVAGAYSHIACTRLFPGQEYIACDTFEIAMELVKNGNADKAVIPVENSNAGRVSDVHFLLPESGLHIVDEFFMRIEHQLLAVKGAKLANIQTAASHPQALAQCSEFLKAHNIHALSRIDTAKSCEKIALEQDLTKAAIASKLAAEIYGLDILASNIENASNNTTRFLVMQKEEEIPSYEGDKYITSIVFVTKHIPAALYKVLGGFATNGINISKLESYLLNGRFFSAQFYIEVEQHVNSKALQYALAELKFFSESYQILGCYKAHNYRYERMN
ncbi:MAG: prephenate dehydratase [Alphaproteobacteria bacterium]|nr:prephenate dehydratase [Alphaproteobacteria bacterium]MBR3501430.1 prephenate dehydratase [Alphaproteobacteria bacterium]